MRGSSNREHDLMELFIGGYKQGKLKYVLTNRPNAESRVFNDFHLWIKKLMMDGQDARAMALMYVEQHPDCIIIADEIGNGIVPIDPFERRYREEVGRILTELAQKAERVERVTCGLGQRIK